MQRHFGLEVNEPAQYDGMNLMNTANFVYTCNIIIIQKELLLKLRMK